MRLVGFEESPGLLGGPVSASNEGYRDGLAEIELLRERSRLGVVIRLGLVCVMVCDTQPG